MKVRRIVGLLAVLVLVGGVSWHFWQQGEPRRNSLQALHQFNNAIATGDSTKILELVSLPTALAGRTTAEQSEFLTKALRDEISAEGLAVLQHEGHFGTLTNIFPTEAGAWAKQAGVPVENCLAFKLEKNGIRVEVMLFREPQFGADTKPYQTKCRILRCNNVKQLAAAIQL